MEIYSIFSGIIFYTYLYIFLFKKGYLSFINPLKILPILDFAIDRTLLYMNDRKIEIFPHWALFIGVSEKSFFDLKIEAKTLDGEKFNWLVAKDKSIGLFKTKNPFFILSLITHYNSFQYLVNKLIKKNILYFFNKKGIDIDTISINLIEFKLDGAADSEIEQRLGEQTPSNLTLRNYLWQNKKTLKNKKQNIYELL